MYRISIVIFLLCTSFGSVAASVNTPVMIGGDENLDACTSLGVVSGLKPHGDGFLAVRTGASVNYPLIDKLTAGQYVSVCDTSKDGKWLGIVYSDKESEDCGVASPVKPAQPYRGKCKSGWVHSHWIKIIAG